MQNIYSTRMEGRVVIKVHAEFKQRMRTFTSASK